MTADDARAAALILLSQLGQRAPDLCRRGHLGQLEDGEWIALAVVMESAAKLCRQVVALKPPQLYIPKTYPDDIRAD